MTRRLFRLLAHRGSGFGGSVCGIVKFAIVRGRVVFPSSLTRVHVSGPSVDQCSDCNAFAVNKRGRCYAVIVCASEPCSKGALFSCLGIKLMPLGNSFIPIRGTKGAVVCTLSRTRSFCARMKGGAGCLVRPRRVVTSGFTFALANGGSLTGPRVVRGMRGILGTGGQWAVCFRECGGDRTATGYLAFL